MKKIVMLLLVAALLVPMFAQETTLITKDMIDADFVPAGMKAWTTNGMFYDEWDIILRSPAELSNYNGYGLYTAYGNYQGWRSAPLSSIVNPFMTTTFVPGSFFLGATMPIMDFRAGVLLGFDGSVTGNLTGDSVIEYGDNDTVKDVTGLLNQYAWSEASSYTDYTQNTYIGIGTGVDLGFMGVSLAASIAGNDRYYGGTYDYTYTKSTATADPAYVQALDLVTAFSVDIGGNADGAARRYGNNGSWGVKILGDLPMLSWMPITAAIRISGDSAVAPASNLIPASTTQTIGNLTGATTLTATLTTVEAASAAWDVFELGTPAAENTLGYTGFALTAADKAIDVENYKNSSFDYGLEVKAEPTYQLAERVNVNGLVGINFDGSASSINNAYLFSENFTGATGATTANNRLTTVHTYSETDERSVVDTTLAFDLGGVVKVNAVSDKVTFGLGLVVSPEFFSRKTTRSPAVTTQSWSVSDPANTIPDQVAVTTVAGAAALMTNAAAIGSEGTKTSTTTTTYTAPATTKTSTVSFLVPVSAEIKLHSKWSLFGGYDISYAVSSTEVITSTESSSTTYAITNAAGTSVYTPTDAVAPTVTTGDKTVTPSNTTLAGRMGFMVRWMPTEVMTIDLSGTSVMNALNFGLFGGGAGFNPRTFINSLSMSVSFRL